MIPRSLTLPMLACLLATAGCAAQGEAAPPPSPSPPAQAAAAQGWAQQKASKAPVVTAPAKRSVARIVFLDQVEACDCTKHRIETSWATLQAAFGGTPAIPIERIHLDTQAALAEPYRKLRPVMVAPAAYFLDAQGQLIEMLQGELTEEQVRSVLQGE